MSPANLRSAVWLIVTTSFCYLRRILHANKSQNANSNQAQKLESRKEIGHLSTQNTADDPLLFLPSVSTCDRSHAHWQLRAVKVQVVLPLLRSKVRPLAYSRIAEEIADDEYPAGTGA